jgi:hypothetical protein
MKKALFGIYSLTLILTLCSCQDKAIVNIYDKDTASTKLECINLVVFPPDLMVQNTLNSLYNFTPSCPIKLEISKKSSIVCNSNQNSDKKALSNFPTSYLRMQLSKDNKVFYDYYIDLDHKVDAKDIKNAFERIRDDLLD